jgi:predicted phosphoribosyltransferase
VIEVVGLRDRLRVFRDRRHAGEIVAGLLEPERAPDAMVLAIPAGGVPVAVPIAQRLGLALDLAVVSKITMPWSTEAGYGAVAFDGTTRLNEPLLRTLPLSRADIDDGIRRTREKVLRRVQALRGGRGLDLRGRRAILVDDGLASGITMRVAVEAVRNAGAARVVVAVPTAHRETADAVEREVDVLYVPNVRSGASFAVADAYEHWHDVSDTELTDLLRLARIVDG